MSIFLTLAAFLLVLSLSLAVIVLLHPDTWAEVYKHYEELQVTYRNGELEVYRRFAKSYWVTQKGKKLSLILRIRWALKRYTIEKRQRQQWHEEQLRALFK